MNRAQLIVPPLAVAGLVVAALLFLAVVRERPPSRPPAADAGSPLLTAVSACDSAPAMISARDSALAATVIGRPAPEWGDRPWIHSPPLTWESLRGRPVLLRFWTDGCPYCAATAPALAELDRRYRPRGLAVIGVYHPKPPRPVTAEEVETRAAALSLAIPIAIDADWSLLRRYWLDHGDAGWTSVSFLVDGDGIIRHVHPGGEYHAGGGPEHAGCRAAFAEIERSIETLLASSREP